MTTLFAYGRRTQLRRLRALAAEALGLYGLRPDALRLLRYEDNAVYAVEAGGARYALRMTVRDGRTAAEQAAELDWLAAMAARGRVRVPEPVPTLAGPRVATLAAEGLPEPSTVVLFRWLAGRADPAYSPAVVAGLGRLTGLLHDEAAAYRPPPGFTRPSWDLDDLFDRGAALTDPRAPAVLGPDGVAVLRAAGARLRGSLPARGDDWGLIHADLHGENVVVTGDGSLAPIDFDDCGFGWHMLDLATALSSVHRRHDPRGEPYPALARRYVDAYREVRPLPATWDHLEAFLVLRDVVIVDFVTGSRNPTVADWGPARARGIVAQLARWLDGAAYPGTPAT